MENKLTISTIILILLIIPSVFAGWGDLGWGNCEGGWGICEVVEKKIGDGEGTPSGGGGNIAIPSIPSNETFKRYDLSIELDKNVYQLGDTVKATITIENKGDIPDEDTVLTFWLSNPINRMFGETREQFLEIPIGKSIFQKNITIPSDDLSGEWRFNIKYFTSVQPTIDAYKSFEVKQELNIIDRLRNQNDKKTLLGWGIVAITIFVVVQYSARKDFLKKLKENNPPPPSDGQT
ncbi:MAG: hypothetical protein AABY15_08150 [Nanoarchaeota archaeon]